MYTCIHCNVYNAVYIPLFTGRFRGKSAVYIAIAMYTLQCIGTSIHGVLRSTIQRVPRSNHTSVPREESPYISRLPAHTWFSHIAYSLIDETWSHMSGTCLAARKRRSTGAPSYCETSSTHVGPCLMVPHVSHMCGPCLMFQLISVLERRWNMSH